MSSLKTPVRSILYVSCLRRSTYMVVEAERPIRRQRSSVIEGIIAADAFCFDVDSTVCTDEGIDELAAFCGAGEARCKKRAR
eukprot:3367899-Pyramimonas_sp.AAC.1